MVSVGVIFRILEFGFLIRGQVSTRVLSLSGKMVLDCLASRQKRRVLAN